MSKKSKRPQVPTALHAELTEYSSLLRALRTSATADLATHLTQGSRSSPAPSDDVSLANNDERADHATEEPPPTEHFSSEVGSSRPTSPVLSRVPGKGQRRDTWTRWPLLAGDVHVPEWSLPDEVRHIAECVLASPKGQVPLHHRDVGTTLPGPGESSSTPNLPSTSDEADDAIALSESSLGLQALTADAAAFLARVLALVSAHVPAAEKSMQNRVRPISWETVVDVACAHGVVTPSIARTVHERMSRIYPPSQSHGIHRAEHLLASNEPLAKILGKHDDDLLAVPVLPSEVAKPVKRKRGPYKKRKASSEVDVDSPKRMRSEEG
ncbi:hypothetical protein OH76DRAFT_1400424 [Lentinus brumalis]|uniref:Uncharacterized protein n=1 Tax=Lentinus brumalis TaxID=2498619 RepID=A0A371DJB1_9APHY|nr:hypothetical protein OH76DRAFT_1400424 [Polyporus brumalis]